MSSARAARARPTLAASRFSSRRSSARPAGGAASTSARPRSKPAEDALRCRATSTPTGPATEAEVFQDAEDRVIRLATTLNAYEHVAFTSRATNMGTYVYEQLALVPERYRYLLIDELTDRGLTNCWFIAGLLYKIKLAERETDGPMDISNDLEAYQERLETLKESLEGREERHAEGDGRPRDATTSRADDDDDDDAYESLDFAATSTSRRRVAAAAARAGVQVFEGRAANVPGGPFVNRFQKVLYPSPTDETGGTWHGRVVLKKPKFVETFLPLYFRTNDTLERFLTVPATGEPCDLSLDYQNPPYLESDMPPDMRYPSRRTDGVEDAAIGTDGDVVDTRTWWPIPKLPPPPFDTLVDYLRPLGPGVYAGKGWRGGGRGDEFLTFLLVRRVDVGEEDLEGALDE